MSISVISKSGGGISRLIAGAPKTKIVNAHSTKSWLTGVDYPNTELLSGNGEVQTPVLNADIETPELLQTRVR